ncbi:MAG: urea amidolyase associated protein UAAP1 [Pseudomonadales bacterium]
MSNVIWSEEVPGGAHTSCVMRRGTALRVTARHPGVNASIVLFNYEQLTERYDMADTLKGQHTAFLTANHVLYSDMGRAMCSITADTCGWHDPFCGVSDAAGVAAKYGEARYQEHRNGYYRNGSDSLLNELGKYGLGIKDLIAPVNLFSKVTVDESGMMQFHPEHAAAGDYVDLRFEMHCLMALTTCQHPLDPERSYLPGAVLLECRAVAPPGFDDPARQRCPENARAFTNTERMFPQGVPA